VSPSETFLGERITCAIFLPRHPVQVWTEHAMWDIEWSRRCRALLARKAGGAGPYANDFGRRSSATIWIAPGVDVRAADGSGRRALNGSELVRLGLRPIANLRTFEAIEAADLAWCEFCRDWVSDIGSQDGDWLCSHLGFCPAGECGLAYRSVPKGRRLSRDRSRDRCRHDDEGGAL
jgi:hypothetical protein